jgi:hypothetical protein
MKFWFALIVMLHGVTHVLGFAKAFQWADINQLSQNFSKPIGILWLMSAFLFFVSTYLFLLKKDSWFLFVIMAVLLSQILIIIFWKDAKFGTIPNFLIFIVGLSALGQYRFNSTVKKETEIIVSGIHGDTSIILEKDVKYLPEIIQQWMQASGVIGKEKVSSVRLIQIGEMRTTSKSKWMSFMATQSFNVEQPSFIWITEVDVFPIIKMVGRDKLFNGQGEMLIKLASLLPVVNEANNKKINSGSMLRYLAEIVWFLSAALNNYISWEAIDETSAKAQLTINDESVSGIFLNFLQMVILNPLKHPVIMVAQKMQ